MDADQINLSLKEDLQKRDFTRRATQTFLSLSILDFCKGLKVEVGDEAKMHDVQLSLLPFSITYSVRVH